jgi:hypothetical protein
MAFKSETDMNFIYVIGLIEGFMVSAARGEAPLQRQTAKPRAGQPGY